MSAYISGRDVADALGMDYATHPTETRRVMCDHAAEVLTAKIGVPSGAILDVLNCFANDGVAIRDIDSDTLANARRELFVLCANPQKTTDTGHAPNCPRAQFWDAGEIEAPCHCLLHVFEDKNGHLCADSIEQFVGHSIIMVEDWKPGVWRVHCVSGDTMCIVYFKPAIPPTPSATREVGK